MSQKHFAVATIVSPAGLGSATKDRYVRVEVGATSVR